VKELHPTADIGAATWIGEAVTGPHGLVGGLIPAGFKAYARVLHRAVGPDGMPATWTQVAAQAQRRMHRLAQFTSIAGRTVFDPRCPSGWPGENPVRGSLDPQQLQVLSQVLAEHSSPTQPCYLLLWEGWGTLPPEWRRGRLVLMQPGREYLLFQRPVADVVAASRFFALPHPAILTPLTLKDVAAAGRGEEAASETVLIDVQSPNQWWPMDRSWFVATDIDYDSTIIAGNHDLITRVTSHPDLEAFPIDLRDDISADGDTVNSAGPFT